MPMKKDISAILSSGSPKKKALLVIEDNLARERNSSLLTDRERDAIVKSFKDKPLEFKEYNSYLDVAYVFEQNRFRIFSLQESLNKIAAALRGFFNILELSEQYAEISNNLLALVEDLALNKESRKRIEDFVYDTGKGWNKYVTLRKVAGERRVDTDKKRLQAHIDDLLAAYTANLSIAKAIVIASDEFVEKCKASAFVPSDIRNMLDAFRSPNTLIPAAYRRDEYLRLLKEKGEEDIEVQIAKKYAVVPSYEEISPVGLDSTRKIFNPGAVLYAK